MDSFLKLIYSSSSSSSASILLVHITSLLIFSGKSKALVKLPPNVSIPALIVFGDSIMDTGNNNNMKTLAKCNFPPYGRDFKGGIPTGRFSNGKVPSDFVAEELGIKDLLPAYLDPNIQPVDLITGVCFASGASGFDPLTSQLGTAISMSKQRDMFREYIGKLRRILGAERANFIISNSIILVVSGSNDISNTYYLSHARELQYDFPAYTDLLLNSASDFIKEIYELGARRIGVFSVPPIGCVPFQRTLLGGIERACAKKYNDAAKLFNSRLSKQLDCLNHNLPKSRIVYMDVYNPLLDVILNYQNYGYKVGDRGCCGTGKVEAAVLCNHLDATCSDVRDYVFWDSFHPTESVYRKLVEPVLRKYMHQFF